MAALDWQLPCGTCDPTCSRAEHAPDQPHGGWGGGIAGFPIIVHPGERTRFSRAGVEIGALLTPHGLCDADLEIIALFDIIGYLGPVGAAMRRAVDASKEVAHRLHLSEPELSAGVDVSGTLQICKGAGQRISFPSARLCGGAFILGGFNLRRDRGNVPH